MKRIILSIMALSMLAATSLQGQAAAPDRPAAPQVWPVQVDYRMPVHGQDVRGRNMQGRNMQGRNVQGHGAYDQGVYGRGHRKPAPRYDSRRDHGRQDNLRDPGRYDSRRTAKKPNDATRHDRKRGQHYSHWRRHAPVRDYHRHGLKRPAPGQHWIRVDNDYLLVGLATGLIAGVIAAR